MKQPTFLAFDLYIGDRYVDEPEFRGLCAEFGVGTAPQLGVIPYELAAVRALASGPTYTGKGRQEGVVVRPVQERRDAQGKRVIYKYIADEQLLDLAHEDATDA